MGIKGQALVICIVWLQGQSPIAPWTKVLFLTGLIIDVSFYFTTGPGWLHSKQSRERSVGYCLGDECYRRIWRLVWLHTLHKYISVVAKFINFHAVVFWVLLKYQVIYKYVWNQSLFLESYFAQIFFPCSSEDGIIGFWMKMYSIYKLLGKTTYSSTVILEQNPHTSTHTQKKLNKGTKTSLESL